MADVLVGKAVADGRLSVAVADLFKPGDGVTITPKVPRIYRPEDYGCDSKYWKKQVERSVIRRNQSLKAYPGCQILIFKRWETSI